MAFERKERTPLQAAVERLRLHSNGERFHLERMHGHHAAMHKRMFDQHRRHAREWMAKIEALAGVDPAEG